MNQGMGTQIRRHLDIVAFKKGSGPSYAFHATNMQVAEISDETWNLMPQADFQVAEELKISEARQSSEGRELEDWLQSRSDVQSLEKSRNKFNLTLNITQLCNLHCHYCAAGGDGTYGDPVGQISVDKTLPQIKAMMNRLQPGGEFHITFLGGEPMMYPGAIRAIGEFTLQTAQKLGLHSEFQIITNGTLLTDLALDQIESLRPTITLSLDGPPEVNDRQRPQRNGSSSSSKAVEGLQCLLKRKSRFGSILLHAVLNKKNIDVVNTWKYFEQFSVDKMEFTFDITEKDEVANQDFVSGLKEVARLAVEKGGEKELRRLQFFDTYFHQLDGQYRRENHCGSGKSLLSLDSRNQVYQCPLEVSFKERMIGTAEKINWGRLEALSKPLIELNQCGSCWARHLCGGGCMFNHESLTGDKHIKHPTYCFRTRHLLSEVLSYYKSFRERE